MCTCCPPAGSRVPQAQPRGKPSGLVPTYILYTVHVCIIFSIVCIIISIWVLWTCVLSLLVVLLYVISTIIITSKTKHMTIAIIVVVDSAIIIAITMINITIIIIRTIITYMSKYIIRYYIAIITFLDKTLFEIHPFISIKKNFGTLKCCNKKRQQQKPKQASMNLLKSRSVVPVPWGPRQFVPVSIPAMDPWKKPYVVGTCCYKCEGTLPKFTHIFPFDSCSYCCQTLTKWWSTKSHNNVKNVARHLIRAICLGWLGYGLESILMQVTDNC